MRALHRGFFDKAREGVGVGAREKHVYVVLMRSGTALSRLIHKLTGDTYTHAALALDRNLEYMFSFGRRRAENPFCGCFKRERLNDGIYKNHTKLPGVILELPVTAGQYERVRGIIESFLLDSHMYDYNVLGLVKSLLQLPGANDTRFFCSEFVYHVLYESGVCDFGMDREHVRPQTLLRLNGRIAFEGNLIKRRQIFGIDARTKHKTRANPIITILSE
jgi:hypothetical protein